MPGSGKQSAHVQQQIVEFLEAGIDPTTIHRRLKVGRSSIYRMKRCLQQHGTAYAPPETNKKNGRPKVMTAEQEFVSLLMEDLLSIRTFALVFKSNNGEHFNLLRFKKNKTKKKVRNIDISCSNPQEIRTWLQDPPNRDRYLDDMVWFIHDRFGMVCSTTTCSKIKRKWLKVIEAEERGERLDPAEAQKQVRQEAFRVGKKPTVSDDNKDHNSQSAVMNRQTQNQNVAVPSNPLVLSLSPTQNHMSVPLVLDMASMLQHQQQHQPLPQYAPQIDQSLLHGYTNQRLQQQQLQTQVAHAALHQHHGGV
jgi:hypothetical protein